MLKGAFLVLKPDGRFAVSDVVVRGEVPSAIRKSMELCVGCVAGALSESHYTNKVAKVGFSNIDVEVTRVHGSDGARTFLATECFDGDAFAKEVDGKVVSAFIRAAKPESCCAGLLLALDSSASDYCRRWWHLSPPVSGGGALW